MEARGNCDGGGDPSFGKLVGFEDGGGVLASRKGWGSVKATNNMKKRKKWLERNTSSRQLLLKYHNGLRYPEKCRTLISKANSY